MQAGNALISVLFAQQGRVSWSNSFNLMPSEPLNPGGHSSFSMRCYGFDADVVGSHASGGVKFGAHTAHLGSKPLQLVGEHEGWHHALHINHTDADGVVTQRWVYLGNTTFRNDVFERLKRQHFKFDLSKV